LCVTARAGETVAGWRHDGTGSFPEANPPTEWGPDTNVVWKTRLAKWSNSSPAIVGDRIFVCAEPSTLVCLSRADGKILWQKPNEYSDVLGAEEAAKIKAAGTRGNQLRKQIKTAEGQLKKVARGLKKTPNDAALKKQDGELKSKVAELKKEFASIEKYVKPLTNGVNGYTSATPTTDGKHVYVHFCSGVVACYDVDGNRKWAVIGEKPTHFTGHSSSPVLIGDRLIVHVLSVRAYDANTGKELWKVPHTVDYWGSLVRARIGDTGVVVTPNGEIIRASDGKVLAEKVSRLQFATPVVMDGVIYFIQNPGHAVRLPESAEGTARPEVLWTVKPKRDRYYGCRVHQEARVRQGQVLPEHHLGREVRLRQPGERHHRRARAGTRVQGRGHQQARALPVLPGLPRGPDVRPHDETPVLHREVAGKETSG
jgi:outer membrane protein assembly factor BamB